MFLEYSNRNYSYSIYGLKVKSEIMISELMSLEKDILEGYDVEICLGTIPELIHNLKVKLKNYEASENEITFHVDRIAKYYISEGKKIIIEPDKDASLDDIKIYLLGSAFGALLIQRDSIAIHGGALVVGDRAVVFTGDMGAGKSTITSAFRLKGYSFLADDVSVITPVKGELPKVNPGYPQQKLCMDAMVRFGYNPERFKKVDIDRNKFAIPVYNDFVKEPVSIRSIIELKVDDVDGVRIDEIKGSEKFKIIYKNIYRVGFINDIGLKPSYYMNFINIIKDIELYRVTRPREIFSVEEQIKLIIEALNKKRIAV